MEHHRPDADPQIGITPDIVNKIRFPAAYVDTPFFVREDTAMSIHGFFYHFDWEDPSTRRGGKPHTELRILADMESNEVSEAEDKYFLMPGYLHLEQELSLKTGEEFRDLAEHLGNTLMRPPVTFTALVKAIADHPEWFSDTWM